ncbi:MAG: hypothetical protein AAF215_01340 [Cyanobacteria bacterium P01_A01_bin.123]
MRQSALVIELAELGVLIPTRFGCQKLGWVFIGVAQGTHEGLPLRDWLHWYDPQGQAYPAPENVIALERARAAQEQQRRLQAEALAAQERQQREELLQKLRDRGIDPDTL